MLKGIEACLVKMSATYFYDVAATNFFYVAVWNCTPAT